MKFKTGQKVLYIDGLTSSYSQMCQGLTPKKNTVYTVERYNSIAEDQIWLCDLNLVSFPDIFFKLITNKGKLLESR